MATTLTGEQLEEIKQQAADHFWPHARQAGRRVRRQGSKGRHGRTRRLGRRRSGRRLVRSDIRHVPQEYRTRSQGDRRGGLRADAGHQLLARRNGDSGYRSARRQGRGPGPDKESRIYFISGGSEAVETALKMAKQYHNNNGEAADGRCSAERARITARRMPRCRLDSPAESSPRSAR